MPNYQATIPTGTVDLDQDYLNLQNNFRAIDSYISRNHIPFSSNSSNSGKHTAVEMLNTIGNIIPPGLANFEGTLYTKSDGTQSQLWFTNDNSGNEYQLSRIINASFAKFATNTSLPIGTNASGVGGFTFLPGGMLLQYGQTTPPSGGVSTTVFQVPFTNTPFSIVGTAFSNTNNRHFFSLKTASNTQFTAVNNDSSGSGENVPYFWIAIGI